MNQIPNSIGVASLRTHRVILTVSNDGAAEVFSNLDKIELAAILRTIAESYAPANAVMPCLDEVFTGQPCPGHASTAEPSVPRTERQHWQSIADALNAANAVGMPVGIDLDGTLTDHNAWSVVWNSEAGRWELAGYEDGTL
ncbi:hypothetical protein [Streptomyces sp. NPDC006477]|uniref:hypothetical protein n=1 Tax=Streptomyces sp. NPDC006477 TaxID=3364747 RepID=UPI0036A16F59